MSAVLTATIWAAWGGLFLWRLDRFANRWLDQTHARTKAPERDVIPEDLVALILSEDGGSPEATKFAQQSVEEAIRESYSRLKNWNQVRAAMGIGALD